jgi:hypothetical protein
MEPVGLERHQCRGDASVARPGRVHGRVGAAGGAMNGIGRR